MFTMIGLFVVLAVFIYAFAKWAERSLWIGSWPKLKIIEAWDALMPNHKKLTEVIKKLDETEEILRKFKVYADARDNTIEALCKGHDAREKEFIDLFDTVNDVDGLKAQVVDLNQVLEWTRTVLEWTRTSLNEANQNCREQMGQAHEVRARLDVSEDVRRYQYKSLRRGRSLIRELEAHVAERDGVIVSHRVIEKLRFLLAVNKEKPVKKCLLDKRGKRP